MSYTLFPIVILRFIGIKTPYLLTLQEGDPWEHMFKRWFILPFRPLSSFGLKKLLRGADNLDLSCFVGSTDADTEATWQLCANGVDLKRFIASIHSAVETGGSRESCYRISDWCAKMHYDDVMPRARVHLPAQVQFVIYGSGPEESALKHLADKLQVAGRVLFKGYARTLHARARVCDGTRLRTPVAL
jgi:glycosyltransferase involved in cell wall biosynthesis